MICILQFKTIRYKSPASGKNIHSIAIYKLMRLVSILWLPKKMIKKTGKNNKLKNMSKRYVEAIKKWTFQ